LEGKRDHRATRVPVDATPGMASRMPSPMRSYEKPIVQFLPESIRINAYAPTMHGPGRGNDSPRRSL
jgi:hypothetical protein